MSLETFLAVKEAFQSNAPLQQALGALRVQLGEPVLTLRTITEFGAALGGPRNRGTYEKRLHALGADRIVRVTNPAIVAMNLRIVYAAAPALEYLSTVANVAGGEDVRSHLAVDAIYSAQPLNTPQPVAAYGERR